MPKAATSSRNPISQASSRPRGTSDYRVSASRPTRSLAASRSVSSGQARRSLTQSDRVRQKSNALDGKDPKTVYQDCIRIIGKAKQQIQETRQRDIDALQQVTAEKNQLNSQLGQLSEEKQRAIDESQKLKAEIQQVKKELERVATTLPQHQAAQGYDQQLLMEINALSMTISNKILGKMDANKNASMATNLPFSDMGQASWSDNTVFNNPTVSGNQLSGTQDGLMPMPFAAYPTISQP